MSVHQLFKRLQTVGKGSFGSVHKGLHIPTGNVVAIKIINLDTDDGEDVEAIQREIALLTQLRDAPNVTKYYSCHLDGPRVWIIMEFAQGGSVYSLMKASPGGCIEEKYAVVIVREVLIALSYLHKSSIIHRDIKAANILTTSSGKVMLCDFGVSALLATSSSKRNTLMGTPHWMAPEVVAVNPSYDTKADIWSLGITIHEMIKGAPPHFNITEQIRAMEIIAKAAPPRLADADGSKDLRDFVALCLREVPSERPTADDLTKAKWMKNVPKLSTLMELIGRYETQIAKEGPRASLAEPLPWEEEEERDRFDPDSGFDRHSWAFDTLANSTIRGRMHPSFHDNQEDGLDDDLTLTQSTIRAPAASTLPTSLRALFQEEEEVNYEDFNLPVFQSRVHGSPAPALVIPDPPDDLASSNKESTFAFPTRGRQKHDGHMPPLGPGIPRKKSTVPATTLSVQNSDDSESSNGDTIRYPLPIRETHDSPKQVEITIPPLDKSNQSLDTPVFRLSEEGRSSPETSSSRASSSGPSSSRKRSQTSTEAIRPPVKRSASYAQDTFQFPTSASTPSKLTPPSLLRSTDRRSPSRTSISSTSHKSNHSLDTNESHKHEALRSPIPPPSRAKSATAYSEVSRPIPPSLSRAPTTIPEDGYPLMPPIKPFARRNRSGSSGSDGNMSSSSLGVPGLKEVLKVPSLSSEHHLGMADLLPPSPSVLHHNARNFAPSPSTLGSASGSVTDLASFREAVASTPSLPVSSFSLGIPHTHSPPSFDAVKDPPTTGPIIQPLDYSELIGSDEMTHAELAKTVNNLTQWLSVVEFGLSGMLDSLATDTIEEEEEGVSTGNMGAEDESDDYSFLHTSVTAR